MPGCLLRAHAGFFPRRAERAEIGKREEAESSGLNFEELLKGYVAAGFDPARFWEITPRLWAFEMAGAAEREKRNRAMIWWGAMMPHMKKPPSFDEFVEGRTKPRDVKAWNAAWDRIDKALARNRPR